jgi:signal transduction histidine kinase
MVSGSVSFGKRWGVWFDVSVQTTVFHDQLDLDAVIHDLRQPLAGIRALASVPLPRAGEDGLPEELSERLRRIGELGEWMNELLCSGLLPEEQAAGPAPHADAARVVQDVMLAAAASFRGSLRCYQSGAAPVQVDPCQLRRAVGNVVDNATRAAGPGGSVEVRLRRARGRVCVEVEDSGPGFGRMPPQTCRGLGVTRAVVDACGGAMEIRGRRSGGALVRLMLPMSTTDAPT